MSSRNMAFHNVYEDCYINWPEYKVVVRCATGGVITHNPWMSIRILGSELIIYPKYNAKIISFITYAKEYFENL